ncbi:MAG: hypothetical protein P1P86_03360 [Bacteroidales bacterium]|nr:hypothetical protein [Bacteroidales bacterium]
MRLFFIMLFISVLPFVYGEDSIPEEPPPGVVSARIFSHFNYSLDPENHASGFEVKRAYFAYKRELDSRFTAEVKLDVGSIDDASEFALIRRYAYFKNAYLGYRKGKLMTWFGLMDMLQFKVQEKFFGYRYLYRSYLDEYRFGSSADLGAGIQYSPSGKVTADLVLSNGEGYKSLQFDNVYRLGAGITLYPSEKLLFRAYYTIHTTKIPQMIFSGFAGYRLDRFRIGAEYNHQLNYQFFENRQRYGYSVYSTFTFSEKWEVFARYDQVYSNILPEQELPWNLGKDGSAIISGIQYTPIKFVRLALNYQDWVEYAQNGSSEPCLYLNIEIVF